MRKIDIFSGGNLSQDLAEICTQTKTAAAWTDKDFRTEAQQKTSKIFFLIEN